MTFTRRDILLTSAAAALVMPVGIRPATAAGVAQQPKKGGALHLVVQPEPPMLMQGLSQNAPTDVIAGNIYESLLRYDEKLNPRPSLAKSWEVSPDGKIYTFKLQKGVTWHDGHPFTADDVVFSLDKFLRKVHPRWRPLVDSQVQSIEKVDDLTVRINLKHPFAPLINSQEVSSAPIVPKHIYDGTDYATNPANNNPIGTGPYKFKEWKKGSYVHLVKNENYWMKGRPFLDDIYYHFIPDAAARAIAYEKGTVDVLTAGSVEVFDAARLAKLPNTSVTTKGFELFAPLAWITINVRHGILGNKPFRQALMYAIDRNAGRDVVWSGFGKVPTGPISSKTKFYSADVKKYPYDPQKAKELIKASGYKGEVIHLLALPYGELWARWAEAVKQNLLDVGVNVVIDTSDVPGWTQKTSSWDFDLAFTFLYQFGDPALGVSRSYISSNIAKGNPFANVGGYSNPEVDKLFAQAAVTSDEAERQKLYTKVQQILVEDVPVLWLLEMELPTIYRSKVKDLVTSAVGVDDSLRDTWIE